MSMLDQVFELPLLRQMRERRYTRRFASARAAGCYLGKHASHRAAAGAAPSQLPIGYDNPDAGRMYVERLSRVYPADYPMLFWLNRLLPDTSRVFDLGGHVGIAWYAYQQFLRYPTGLRWTVYDMPAVIAEGARLASERGARTLDFTPRIDDGDGADVLIAAGSLQYMEEQLNDVLMRWSSRPRHLLINKTPTHESEEYYTLQNIGASYCPYRIAHVDRLPAALGAMGYEQVDRWECAELHCTVPFAPGANPITYRGWYFRLGEA